MRALDRKLMRDLWRLRGPVVAVGLIIASGVALLIMSLSTLEALKETANAYYERYRMADVFARLNRAPRHAAARIEGIPGVQAVEARIIRYATLDVEGFPEPVLGQLVSQPPTERPVLHQLALRSGRRLDPARPGEVLLSEPFAEAHGLSPGDELTAVLNGHRRVLTVVGTALSPEFVYSLGPGSLMPDDRRFGVLFMAEEALAAAFDLEGAFNDVVLSLSRGTEPASVIGALDRILEPYGGTGAIARKDQLSNWFVMNEIDQLATLATLLPAIFLAVAAFLTNMVLDRLIATEREQIGLLKAFGYGNLAVGWHYTKMVLVIAALGVLLGMVFGSWFGWLYTKMYAELFRFPLLLYRPSVNASVLGAGLSVLAALAGALGAVGRAARLPPAQAMQPPAPPVYRQSSWSSTRAARWLDQPTRIILRHMGRWPLRSALTCLGISFSVGLLVLALQWNDSIDHLAHGYFFEAQHQNAMVGLAEPQGTSVVRDFLHLPGVLEAEATRSVSADLSVGPIRHRGSLVGLSSEARLQPIFDDTLRRVVPLPEEGLVLGTRLAQKLGVGRGDEVWVDVLEGRRPSRALPVVDLFETKLGMPAYLHFDALHRLLDERPKVEYLNLLLDPAQRGLLFSELKEIPRVSAVLLRRAAVDSFYDNLAKNMMVFVSFFLTFACALGFGVAYNSSRIALSERGRELATLRVLGFSRGEVSYILLGEVGLLIALALPFGCVLGLGLATLMASAFDTELFRIPIVIRPFTYGLSALIALAAAGASAALVRRRIDRLDLIEVLKTRE